MRRVIDREPFDGVVGPFNLVISFHIFPSIGHDMIRDSLHDFSLETQVCLLSALAMYYGTSIVEGVAIWC